MLDSQRRQSDERQAENSRRDGDSEIECTLDLPVNLRVGIGACCEINEFCTAGKRPLDAAAFISCQEDIDWIANLFRCLLCR